MDAVTTVLYYVFGIISASYVLHFGFYLTGASVYDILLFWRNSQFDYDDVAKTYQPLVSVLVPAHNEEKVIVRCLDYIYHSTYKNIEVIVVDDGSTDSTTQVLRRYKSVHAHNLRVVQKRLNVGKGAALNYALRKYVRGELVMTVDADSVLSPQAIGKAVRYFVNPTVAGVAANVQMMNSYTTLGLLQKFEHMIGYRSKKVYSLTNCEFVIGGVASTYRMEVLKAVGFYDTDTLTEDIGLSMKIVANGNRAHRIIYAADVMAMTEPVDSFMALMRQRHRWKYGSLQNIFKHAYLIGKTDRQYTRMLTMYRMPMALFSELLMLLAPLAWAYAIYLSFIEHSLILVLGAYITITLYTLLTVWHDEHTKRGERLHLTLYVPIAYFTFYIMDAVQFVSVVRCLFHIRQLIQRKDSGSVWVSPERLGRELDLAGQVDA